jgi:hypothetical protein
MRRFAGGSLAAVGLLLMLSCSDSAMFGPQGSVAASIETRSLPEGALVAPEQPLAFVLHAEKPAGEEFALELTLTDAAGKVAWSNTIPSPALEEPLDIRLPGMATGQYRLKLDLTRNSGTTVEKEVSFFYVNGRYSITGISSYPPTAQPQSRILLRAELAYPQGADPYLRWTQDGKLLAQGLVSEGLAQIGWQAPKTEGVYPIQVELFPVAPPQGTDFRFTSPLLATAKLFVTPAASTSEELGPPESYYSLFHFDGTLRDAVAPETRAAEVFGTAAVTEHGLRLGENGGASYPRMILPVAEGLLSPCTVTLQVEAAQDSAGRDLLAIASADRRFRLWIVLDEKGSARAEIALPSGGSLRIPSAIPALPIGEPHRLDLSLAPSPRSLTASWFLDGLQTSLATFKVDPSGIQPEGETQIGGESGFRGLIRELGVYYLDEARRPSVDPAIYRAVMERHLGRQLILAEGFEGFRLPEGFKPSPESSARLAGGQLLLDPGSSLALPFIDLNPASAAQTVLELVFSAPLPAGTRASLAWEGDGKAFLDILPEGQALASSREVASFPPLTDTLRLELGSKSLTLKAPSGPVELALPGPASGTERWLSVSVRSPGGETGVAIDRILAYLRSAE